MRSLRSAWRYWGSRFWRSNQRLRPPARREQRPPGRLSREGDEPISARRNSAVEQERAIKENELNTEIAVENKKRQIRETQMEAERSVQEKKHIQQKEALEANIGQENRRKDLVALAAEN